MSYVRVKSGAGFPVLAPAGIRILAAIDETAQMLGVGLTITSGSEARGRAAIDPHMTGEAADISVAGLDVDAVREVYGELRARLGPQFTVLYESPTRTTELGDITYVNTKATATHIHIQRKKGTTWPSDSSRA